MDRASSSVFSMSARAATLGERTAGTDGHQVVVGLDDVAVAGDHEQVFGVAHEQQRFQAPQVAIAAPVLGELDGRAREIAELVELAFEAFEQCKGIGGAAGEAAEHLAVAERAAPCARCPS